MVKATLVATRLASSAPKSRSSLAAPITTSTRQPFSRSAVARSNSGAEP